MIAETPKKTHYDLMVEEADAKASEDMAKTLCPLRGFEPCIGLKCAWAKTYRENLLKYVEDPNDRDHHEEVMKGVLTIGWCAVLSGGRSE